MRERPLSPHLQVYRWPLSMALSILHRGSGLFLSLGAVFLVWWLHSVSRGGAAHEAFLACVNSWFGRLLLIGWTLAIMFHLLNGIRHLVWDAGWGFEKPQTEATGWAVVFGTLILSAIVVLLAWRALP